MKAMPLFAIASLAPLPLFAAGLWLGGTWVWGVFLYMAIFVALLDQVIPYVAGDVPEGAEYPAADALLVAVAVGHLVAFPMAVWGVAGPSGLGLWERAGLFLGCGL